MMRPAVVWRAWEVGGFDKTAARLNLKGWFGEPGMLGIGMVGKGERPEIPGPGVTLGIPTDNTIWELLVSCYGLVD